jgi:hypothetical protein
MKITRVFYAFRQGKNALRQGRRTREADNSDHPFQAVMLVCKSGSCTKAHELARNKHRFLTGEAPALPLQECTNPESCGCHYASFTDRRLTERREESLASRCYAGPERRRRSGRRSGDR